MSIPERRQVAEKITTSTDEATFADFAKSRLNISEATVIKVGDGDVYKNYTWGINTPRQDFIEQVPKIILTEYQSNAGPLLEDIQYTIKTIGATVDTATGNKVNPYLTIYQGVLTGNIFQLPFFSEYNHTINSTWDDAEKETIVSDIRGVIGKTLGVFQRGSVEKRKVWKGSTAASYSFSFILYNTFNGQSNINKNLEIVRALIHNNLATRTSFATLLPPCFYKLEIPGVRYSPVVSLDGVNVANIGQVNRRKISVPTGSGENVIDMNIPDAWEITISVNELHNESREIYNGTFDNASKVVVIDSEDAVNGENINIRNIGGGGLI